MRRDTVVFKWVAIYKRLDLYLITSFGGGNYAFRETLHLINVLFVLLPFHAIFVRVYVMFLKQCSHNDKMSEIIAFFVLMITNQTLLNHSLSIIAFCEVCFCRSILICILTEWLHAITYSVAYISFIANQILFCVVINCDTK